MPKNFKYFFQHTIFQRGIDGEIIDFFNNHYEIISQNAAIAHTQVPYGSILQVVKSMDNTILHDFREPTEGDEYKRLREKIKVSGRLSLTPFEHEDAVHFGIIK